MYIIKDKTQGTKTNDSKMNILERMSAKLYFMINPLVSITENI